MTDRRKYSREFLISGGDPYVIALTAQSRRNARQGTGPSHPPFERSRQPELEPVLTRWRAMLARRPGRD